VFKEFDIKAGFDRGVGAFGERHSFPEQLMNASDTFSENIYKGRGDNSEDAKRLAVGSRSSRWEAQQERSSSDLNNARGAEPEQFNRGSRKSAEEAVGSESLANMSTRRTLTACDTGRKATQTAT